MESPMKKMSKGLRVIAKPINSIYCYILRTLIRIKFSISSGYDKLIIVAHPDDELIFFGKEILTEKNWLVVCITNGNDRKRLREFMKAMRYCGVHYLIWNYPDGLETKFDSESLKKDIEKVLSRRKVWEKLLTHNSEGDYGHIQHIQIFNIISSVYSGCNMFVPVRRSCLVSSENKLSDELFREKQKILYSTYKSEFPALSVSLADYLEYEACVNVRNNKR